MAARNRESPRLAIAALAAQSAFFGYNWVVMKIGLRYSGPWPFAALRTGLGAITLLLLLIFMRRSLRPKLPMHTALLGLLQTAAMLGLVMWALETGAAGRTSALTYTMPFWVLIFAWVLLGERIAGIQWLTVALAFCGLVLILDPGDLQGSLESKLLAVGSGIAWAASAIVVKRIHRRTEVDILNLTTWQMLFGSIPLVAIALVVGSRPIVWSLEFVGALAFNVIPATAVAWLLWLYVLRVLPAGVAGMGTLATPVIGVVASWLQLGESVEPFEAVGVCLILAALLFLTVRGIVSSGRTAPRGDEADEDQVEPTVRSSA